MIGRLWPMLIAVLLLANGCTVPAANADYGQFPTSYEKFAEANIIEQLIDPESARFRFGFPLRAYMNQGLLRGGGVGHTGYVLPVEVNAKNRVGGYTGFQTWFFLVKDSWVSHCESGSYKNHPLVHVVGG